MQRRTLHVFIARGSLAALNSHCLAGATPRRTVTPARDSPGRTIWQIGGQIAEDGVKMDPPRLAKHAMAEIRECIPGIDLSGVEISTYRIDRAEAATSSGQRPDDVHILKENNVITVFPTKLALAPRLGQRVLSEFNFQRSTSNVQLPENEPPVATPPWEKDGQ